MLRLSCECGGEPTRVRVHVVVLLHFIRVKYIININFNKVIDNHWVITSEGL